MFEVVWIGAVRYTQCEHPERGEEDVQIVQVAFFDLKNGEVKAHKGGMLDLHPELRHCGRRAGGWVGLDAPDPVTIDL